LAINIEESYQEAIPLPVDALKTKKYATKYIIFYFIVDKQ
jgi:hypothetical protein